MDKWIGWYYAKLQECTLNYLDGVRDVVDWLENELTGGDDPGPPGGTNPEPWPPGKGGAGPNPGNPKGPETWWTVPLEIVNETDRPVTLGCEDFRQIGGGVAIASTEIEFVPNIAQPKKNDVIVRINMTGKPVGIWTGYIIDHDHPQTLMSPEPIMPTWAG